MLTFFDPFLARGSLRGDMHMSVQIKSDARISDVIYVLSDPVDYLNGVLGNFVDRPALSGPVGMLVESWR